MTNTLPHTCKFCGAPSAVDPSDQTAPADYCHTEDHGATPTSDTVTALKAAAGVLEAIRPYCLLELSTKYTVTHDGHKVGSFTIDEALDLADAALKEA